MPYATAGFFSTAYMVFILYYSSVTMTKYYRHAACFELKTNLGEI